MRCVLTRAAGDAAGAGDVTGLSIRARYRARRLKEVAAASGGADLEAVIAGWAALEKLLVMEPGSFTPAEGGMKDAEWASLALNIPTLIRRIIVLKTELPTLNIQELVARRPRLLTEDEEALRRRAVQAKRLLTDAGAADVGALVSTLPDLLDPRQCASVLATMARWYPKENAVERLERDPDILLRAGERDQPLDPAFSLGRAVQVDSAKTRVESAFGFCA